MKELSISRGGQISLPAAIRHRWRTDRVLLDDRGDVVVVRPLPADPIGAARGALRSKAAVKTTDDARRQTRREELAADRRSRR
jgi:hypothetical protein